MPKLLLIQPTQYQSDGVTLCKQRSMHLPALTMPLLAAMVPPHWQVKVIIEIVEDIDFDEDCDLVGLGAMGFSVVRTVDVAREFKKRNKTVFVGGAVAPYVPQQMQTSFDSLVLGAGDLALPHLLADFELTGHLKPVYNEPLEHLREVPTPRYDLFPLSKIKMMLPVQATRGCPFQCIFCTTTTLYKGQYLTRPVENVINDIKAIRRLGYNKFFLLDDNLGGDLKYLESLLLDIKKLKMQWAGQCTINVAKNDRLLKLLRESGCFILSIGVESISQEGLNHLHKGWLHVDNSSGLVHKFRNAGFMVFTSFVIGTEYDTVESLKATIKFILANKLTIPIFNMLTPLLGTDLYNQMKNQNRLLHENIALYTGFNCVLHPKNMSAAKLDEMYWYMYDTVYSIKNIFRRIVFSRMMLTHPKASFFSLYVNLNYRRYIKNRIGPLIF